jgi:hypothetical protein
VTTDLVPTRGQCFSVRHCEDARFLLVNIEMRDPACICNLFAKFRPVAQVSIQRRMGNHWAIAEIEGGEGDIGF